MRDGVESALAIAEKRRKREEEGRSARQGRRSLVHFRPFGGHGGATLDAWTLALPPDESALLVAAGATFVAAATTQRLVRVFGLSQSARRALRENRAPRVPPAFLGLW